MAHKAKDLGAKTPEELRAELLALKKESFNLRFQHATGQLDNPHKLSAARREIARLLTIKGEREAQRAADGGEV